jgi:sRNA-binding carbon storage regulator CsrA
MGACWEKPPRPAKLAKYHFYHSIQCQNLRGVMTRKKTRRISIDKTIFVTIIHIKIGCGFYKDSIKRYLISMKELYLELIYLNMDQDYMYMEEIVLDQ